MDLGAWARGRNSNTLTRMSTTDTKWEVTVDEVAAMKSRGEDFLLLDVRQPEEFAICKIEGATLIPLGELGQRLDDLRDLADGRPVIAHCHHGVRSLTAAALLKQAGFENVCSMSGGIDAWSAKIDPKIPRY